MSSQVPTILHFLERVVVQLTLPSECELHTELQLACFLAGKKAL